MSAVTNTVFTCRECGEEFTPNIPNNMETSHWFGNLLLQHAEQCAYASFVVSEAL